MRAQGHKKRSEVRGFSRILNDITAELPAIRDIARNLEISDGILDGEAVALRAENRPGLFQETMKALGGDVPFFFDILSLNGPSLLDQPYAPRQEVLAQHVPENRR